jgi:hypothetical protein
MTEGATTVNLPLFLINLPTTEKSQEMLTLPSLRHVEIRVEAYKDQDVVMNC